MVAGKTKPNPKKTKGLSLNREELIFEIRNTGEPIDKLVLNELANDLKEPINKGNNPNYKTMNQNMLELIYRIFVKKESDVNGKFLEYRFANFLRSHDELKVERIETRCKDFPNICRDLDIVFFNSEGKPIAMAECKDTKPKNSDLDKWLSNLKSLYALNKDSFKKAYFVCSKPITKEAINRFKGFQEVDSKEGCINMIYGTNKIFGALTKISQCLENTKSFKDTGTIPFEIFEVRANEFVKILPNT